MDGIFGILLLLFLGYRNGTRAKLKGQSPVLWGVLTAVAYIFAYAFGLVLVILVFCRDVVDLNALAAPGAGVEAQKLFQQQVLQAFQANALRPLTVFIISLGGYLFIRYLLERKPNKKEPEVHWMDKIGQDNS